MKKIITIFLALTLVITCAIFFAYQWYNNAVYNENISSETIEFIVEEGDNLITLSEELSAKGLIANSEVLKIYLRLNDANPNIKPGIYSIQKGTNLPNLIDILETGTFKASIKVTIPEGLRSEDIADILDKQFARSSEKVIFSKDEFIEIVNNPDRYIFQANVQSFLNINKPAGKNLSGLLFPDTYSFDYDTSTLDVISKLISTLILRFQENNISGVENQTQLKNIYEALTLASIIEWEGSAGDNLNLISGVFHNRLAINLPLQADSTVNFITGKRDPGVLIKDTLIDSPYNTYKYSGLPPTPISNPGIESILASLNPEETEYLYFLHDKSGQTYYAVTYQEHLNNVNRYL